ncbi:MAG: hypothetical protein IKG93_10135 [Clostridiales bacterium]|nr:hypothetical protein [Clostridiales bacterium]
MGPGENKQIKPLIVTLLIIVMAWLALVFVMPKLSIWSSVSQVKAANYTKVEAGKEYTYSVLMPYETLDSFEIYLKDTKGKTKAVSALDAEIRLQDKDGNVLFSQDITSAYESTVKLPGKLSVSAGDAYKWIFRLRSPIADPDALEIGCTDDGYLAFRMFGRKASNPGDMKFTFVFLVVAALVLMYVYTYNSDDLKKKEKLETLLFYAGIVMAVFLVNQFFDLMMISKAGLRMIESIKAGDFFHYYDYSYKHELVQGSVVGYFGYNYSVLTILPVAIILFPFSFFLDANLATEFSQYAVVMYFDIIVAILVCCSIKMTKKVCQACDMSTQYSKNVKKAYAFSSVLIFSSIAIGQLDIFYILLILWALPFYYSKKYKTFSLIMSFAVVMKLFPLMIFIPLILLTHKKVKDILLHTAICLSVPLGIKLIFERGTGYSTIMTMMEEEYSFTDRLFGSNIGGMFGLFVLCFALICIFCYMKKCNTDNKKELLYHSMLAIFAVYGSFMMFVQYNSQWLIPFALSLAFLMPFFNERKLLVLNTILEVLVILLGCIFGDSIHMANFGILASPECYYEGLSIGDILYVRFPQGPLVINTLMASIIIYLVVYFWKASRKEDFTRDLSTEHALPSELVTGKIWVLYGFILFFLWGYFYV